MRASEIKAGTSYAATGSAIQLAKVQVIGRDPATGKLRCQVEDGQVYEGWSRNHGGLDMVYAKPGEIVWLTPRDILRSWEEEESRRASIAARRQDIREVLADMDALLNDMGLFDSQMQLVQVRSSHGERYIAVCVLGIDEIRRLHDQITEQRGVG